MGVTSNYERSKSDVSNTTGIDLSLLVAEKPDGPGAIGGTGNTAELDCRVQADADETGGADVQDLFKIEALPAIDANGRTSVKITVTPINGDASEATPQQLTVVHGENIDAWQTAAVSLLHCRGGTRAMPVRICR